MPQARLAVPRRTKAAPLGCSTGVSAEAASVSFRKHREPRILEHWIGRRVRPERPREAGRGLGALTMPVPTLRSCRVFTTFVTHHESA